MALAAKVKQAAPVKGAAQAKKRSGVAAPAADAAFDLGVLNDVLGFRLKRIQNHLAKAFMDDPRHGEMKSGMFSILALIAANPGVSQGRLAQESGVDKTALVALLDNLEQAGWARRVRDRDDRRKHALHITKEGAKALDGLTKTAHETEAQARGALSAEELDQLLNILDKLYATCFREQEL